MGWINEEGVVELDENGFGVSVWDCLSKGQQEEQMNWTLDKGSSSFDTGEEKESRKVINLYDHSRFEMVSEKDEEVEEEELVNVFDEVEESVDDDELERERVKEEINILNMFDTIGEVDGDKYERKQEEYRLKREKREREERKKKEREKEEKRKAEEIEKRLKYVREEKKRVDLGRIREIDMNTAERFPDFLSYVKEEKGLSLKKFAEVTGLSRSSLYRWMKGDNTPVDVKELIKVVEKAFGVKFKEMTEGEKSE